MIVYHEVAPETISNVMKEGIRRQSRGDKSDRVIKKTDEFLDGHIPSALANTGLSRSDNIYGYLVDAGVVTDITDGQRIDTDKFIQQSKQTVLALDVDPTRCYVSSLDTYDSVKTAIENGGANKDAMRLAEEYWHELVPLQEFSPGAIKRPEIMITYDIEPDVITILDNGSGQPR